MAEGNGRTWSPEIKDLGDKIVALTVSKAVELGDYMETVHGIKAAAGAAVMMAAPAGGGGGAATAEAPPPKTDFTVVLEGVGDTTKRVGVIKLVREITGLGLKEAKEVVEGAPKPVKENAPKDEAEAIKKKLEEAGAKVSLK
jgi:large subunit ribosomal protein L7/L12